MLLQQSQLIMFRRYIELVKLEAAAQLVVGLGDRLKLVVNCAASSFY